MALQTERPALSTHTTGQKKKWKKRREKHEKKEMYIFEISIRYYSVLENLLRRVNETVIIDGQEPYAYAFKIIVEIVKPNFIFRYK